MVDSPQFDPLSNPATAGICPSSVCRRSGHAYPDRTSDAVLDHVVLAARRREDIDEPLAALGLVPGSARSIPGTGPSNVVVAVGTQLLELHYPDASPVDEGSPPYAHIQRQVLDTHLDTALVPVAWVVRFGSEGRLRAAGRRVGYPVIDAPPEPPNGAPYLLGGLGAAFERPWLPAFIHWPHPPHLPPRLVGDAASEPVEGKLGLDVSGPEEPGRRGPRLV